MTPEGIKREKDVDRSQSITGETGSRINIAIVVLLIVAIGFVVVDRLVPEQVAEPVADTVSGGGVEEPDDNSIAVLPFADLSPESDQEYFSDGIAEEILNVLVRIDGLSVASRTTSFGFKGQESLGIPYMAEKMNVRHVLEGSVRKAGDNVRITAQLIDATNDKHLWSETFDRTLSAESIFEIQDEIAQAIVGALGVIIDGGERVQRTADTQNLDAYEAYLRANQLFLSRTDLSRSAGLFMQAVEADPQFARAWAGLSAVAAVAPSWLVFDRDYRSISDEAARKAIALDDSLALPYAVLGLNETKKGPIDWEQSVAYLDASLQRDPKDPTTYLWRGMNYMRAGYFDRALADFRRCLELDPAYELCRRHIANTQLFAGHFDRALEAYEQGLRKGFAGGSFALDAYLLESGQELAFLLAIASGQTTGAEQALAEYQASAALDADYEFSDHRAAIESLFEKQYGAPVQWDRHGAIPFAYKHYEAIQDFTIPYWWFPYPTDWYESEHPRRMIVEAGLPDYWRKNGFPSHCRPAGGDDFDCDIRRLHKKKRGGWVN
jgi:TolB-like protein